MKAGGESVFVVGLLVGCSDQATEKIPAVHPLRRASRNTRQGRIAGRVLSLSIHDETRAARSRGRAAGPAGAPCALVARKQGPESRTEIKESRME